MSDTQGIAELDTDGTAEVEHDAVDLDEVTPEVQAAVDAAVADVEVRCAKDPELVPGDVVEQVALTLPVEVAVALCAQQMGFLPDTVRRRMFEAEHADTIAAAAEVRAEQAALEQRAAARSAKAAKTRAATLAAEAAKETAAIKSATCLSCFQVRSPSGTCGCDE